MALNTSSNLSGPLEYVAASYRDVAGSRLAPEAGAGGRPPQLDLVAATLELCLDQPAAVRRLHVAVEELRDLAHLEALLPRAVEGAAALMDAEFANVQLVDPRDGSLVLVSQRGFGPGFLDHFAVVRDDGSVCGQAARQGVQAVVADVQDDPAFVWHRQVFRAAAVRAVQSTPLIDATGRMVGVISTHASQAGRPSDPDLQILALYGRLAGETIVRRLDDVPADSAPPASSAGSDQALIDPRWTRLVSETVDRLLAAGLSLAGAQQYVTDVLAAQQVQDGIDSLDEAVRAIQQEMARQLVEQRARLNGGSVLTPWTR